MLSQTSGPVQVDHASRCNLTRAALDWSSGGRRSRAQGVSQAVMEVPAHLQMLSPVPTAVKGLPTPADRVSK